MDNNEESSKRSTEMPMLAGTSPRFTDRDYADLAGLREELEADSVHPVLVFGTTGSGKKTMLQSLLRYPRIAPDAGITPKLGNNTGRQADRSGGRRGVHSSSADPTGRASATSLPKSSFDAR
jgi:hypothetical protein